MSKVRLAQHIQECIMLGNFSVQSEKDYWEGGDRFSLCSYGMFERNSKTGYNDRFTSDFPPGSWILYQPYRVGWIWDRKWNIRCEKWNGTGIITVTGFTQEEKQLLSQLWLEAAPRAIDSERKLIKEAKIFNSDQTAWHP